LYWCSWSAVEELEGMVAVVFVGYCFEVVEVEREVVYVIIARNALQKLRFPSSSKVIIAKISSASMLSCNHTSGDISILNSCSMICM
jgi:hypothetical protein